MTNENVNYKGFLSKIAEDTKTEDPTEQKNAYNIFQILGIEAKEVLICRLLGFLLNLPDKENRSLKLFLSDVLGVPNQPSVVNARVSLEEVIDNNRRVDLVIEIGENVYPIEVKIWAGDQDTQLADYYDYYFKGNYNKKIYYLTPTGWEPSPKSRGRLSLENIIQLSFFNSKEKHDIYTWVDKLVQEDLIPQELQATVKHFLEVIRNMADQSENEKAILDAVWPRGADFITDELRALITILKTNGSKNGNLQKEIQKRYLRKKLNFDNDKFRYVDNPDDETIKKSDSHALLYIGTKDVQPKIIAWVCVHENLYLGWDKPDENPIEKNWKFISPDDYHKKAKDKAYKLDDCENVLNYSGIIDISNELLDILNS